MAQRTDSTRVADAAAARAPRVHPVLARLVTFVRFAPIAVVLACVAPLGAQGSVVDRLNLDRLQIVSLGAFVGSIAPSQLEPATVGGISADYGEIVPNWRIVVGASFWNSRYRDGVVQAFVDTLNARLGPGGGPRVVASPISLYDVTFGGDLRWAPVYSGELKPFAGIGLAVHVINAQGPLIDGTFVERALDDFTAGVYATTGVSFRLVKHVGLEASVRGDLLSGFRSAQARVGATYFFGNLHGMSPGTARLVREVRP